ncbi:MAG: hypothetical protein JNJ58_05070 [Chitinophagaceae bacterium]|nr:hypothetical protein [Chitinophagaceae bacterium]
MNQTFNVKLIKGHFPAEEAKDILQHMFTKKIHFHEMKNFSSRERYGIDDATSVRRIPELIQSQTEIDEIIQLATDSQQEMLIDAVITIQLIKK